MLVCNFPDSMYCKTIRYAFEKEDNKYLRSSPAYDSISPDMYKYFM